MQKHDLHKEHVNDDGANDLSNCVPACYSCNSQKWKFCFEDWYNESNKSYTEDRINKIHIWLKIDFRRYLES
ncbi:hypothetical protein BSK65_11210 [Paenibacillus odorifer]|uniref:HNH domain-containing protein n=1 Tax=Paenibacillus odorifer TaxID=189426 RepID=A0A1R0ZI40_9BACL|nr:hypothetical protein BSK65_11210 [Paenibacillus odorifer]